MADSWVDHYEHSAVHELVSRLSSDLYGQTTSSIYEPARIVSLALWLGGQVERVRAATDARSGNLFPAFAQRSRLFDFPGH